MSLEEVFEDEDAVYEGEFGEGVDDVLEEGEMAASMACLHVTEDATFIDWSKFTHFLEGALDEDIKAAFVVSRIGTLIACAGALTKESKRTVPPMLVSIWNTTNSTGKRFVNASEMELVYFSCTDGRFAICPLEASDAFFLALMSRSTTHLGYLKIKMDVTTGELSKPLAIAFSRKHHTDDWVEDDSHTSSDDEDELQ